LESGLLRPSLTKLRIRKVGGFLKGHDTDLPAVAFRDRVFAQSGDST
jgi:hypothetical protein